MEAPAPVTDFGWGVPLDATASCWDPQQMTFTESKSPKKGSPVYWRGNDQPQAPALVLARKCCKFSRRESARLRTAQ